MHLDSVLHLMPREGAPSPLYVYLHGAGATALAMVQVADRFAQAYPQAAHLIPDGFVADAAAPGMRAWFPGGVGDDSCLAERVALSLPAADLDLCAVADRFAFAMPVRREEDGDAVEILRADVAPRPGAARSTR